jgi:hypothetical protein
VRQPGTSLVYFPAEEYCVYVLDVTRRVCAGVLYTGHAAGTLRGEPLLLPADEVAADLGAGGPSGWLVLCLAHGDGQTELRPYALPIRHADQAPVEPLLRLAGRASFAPWQDAGKLALATDGGYLSLWGVRQKGNRDPLLFPLLPDAVAVDTSKGTARAQVVHADAENYWMLAHGRLHRLQASFKPQSGPGLLPRWPQPPLLGSPLHAAEHRASADGPGVLYLATQLPGRPTCLVSAVDSDEGRLLWQRQLGCIPQRPPLVVGKYVLVRDANGLFRFDQAQVADDGPLFQSAGELLLREPLAEDQLALLAREQEVVELSWPRRVVGPCKLQMRHLALDKEQPLTNHSCVLDALPHGTPALGAGYVLLPLANGSTVRVRLADGSPSAGPDWRGIGADEQQPGHIVALGGADFLLTDGSRALVRFHWPDGMLPENRGRAELPYRIVAPPAVVLGTNGSEPRIGLADAAGNLTLLDGRLQVLRRWELKGQITAGPFVREGKIGCVVGKGRLVWIDPAKAEPLWQYALPAEIVGEPPLIDGVVVVADVQGELRALDPATGDVRGTSYTLRAHVAPDAAPVAFGKGRLFVPLCDGTIMLLPLQALTDAGGEQPAD